MTETYKMLHADVNEGMIGVNFTDVFRGGPVDTGVTTKRELLEYILTQWGKGLPFRGLDDWIREKDPTLPAFDENVEELSAEEIAEFKEGVRRETASNDRLQEMLAAIQTHYSEPVLFLKQGEPHPYLMEVLLNLIANVE